MANRTLSFILSDEFIDDYISGARLPNPPTDVTDKIAYVEDDILLNAKLKVTNYHREEGESSGGDQEITDNQSRIDGISISGR